MLWKNVDSDVDYISGGIDDTTGYSEKRMVYFGNKDSLGYWNISGAYVAYCIQ